ncbi:MAG TPA: polyhydroxyalkanoic acid system family protein [Pseudolabrys sp.]|nr:polyhydroxyalkanoic acid system family protein [Pseudolabrys sp.]
MKARVLIAVIALGVTLAGSAWAAARQADHNTGHAPQTEANTATSRTLSVSIPHHLPRDEARQRVKDALAGLQKDYGFLLKIDEEVWTGYRLRLRAHLLGQPAVGRIDVEQNRVEINVLLPASLSTFAELAQPVILKQGTILLAKK